MSFIDKINELKKKEKQVIDRAYAQTPVEYHGYILLLEQNLKVANTALDVKKDLDSLGVFVSKDKTYLSQQIPYMTVDGRISMAVDEAVKKGGLIEIGTPEFREISQKLICDVTVKTARGTATGTSKVGIGGGGVDFSNPFENAQTSAIGRALGFQGYGLIGTGIASADEMAIDMKDRQEDISDPVSEPAKKEDKKATTNNKSSNKPKETAKADPPDVPKVDPADKPKNMPKAEPPFTPLGTYQFALRSAKLEVLGDKHFWVIAAERVGTNKTSSIYVDPKIDFEALNASEGEILDITLVQSGSVFRATDIKTKNDSQAVS